MDYEIKTTKASPQLIAAVRARVPRGGVAQAYRDSLDKVWEFLRSHPRLRADGHNLFLYHHEAAEPGFMAVDFGVQVVQQFEQKNLSMSPDDPVIAQSPQPSLRYGQLTSP